VSEAYWREVWESKAGEADFAASGRSSGDPGQLFALLADAAAALELRPEDLLLDVGCGVGLLARHLTPYVRRLVGLDFAVPLLSRAREQAPRGCYAAGSLESLPFRDGVFTKLLASSVLQYLGDDASVGRALREMRRLVAPGGRAFASGNPDQRKKDEYIGGIDRLDLPDERKEQIRERNRKAYWLSPDVLAGQGEAAGWSVEVRAISASVWQSFYMFDLQLIAR
jgi:SAM-dependent methyltransferase